MDRRCQSYISSSHKGTQSEGYDWVYWKRMSWRFQLSSQGLWREVSQLDNGLQVFELTNLVNFILGNSLNEEAFKEKIQEAIKLRQDEIIEKQELQIVTDQRIAQAINKSSLVSSNMNLIINNE